MTRKGSGVREIPVVWPELTRDLAGRFPARVAG
ncbi:MAG: hypothetical protein QOF82_76 [Frankiales bacterium]|jgi:hypothetical protein|nr:hypothetical protein [Frankiales bacterium]MDX6210604.1 hypothetical protein [Frankiales bacterium]MDX6210989.1 hypothetical protein [Frankiales bacterium]MDX6223411.1 hypothetical protein [Frankiales bacterium]